jgi:hypothetical protein
MNTGFKYKAFATTLSKWIFLGSLIGLGIVIGYTYMKYGKSYGNDAAKGNNMIIEAVEGKAKVLKRMGPIVIWEHLLLSYSAGQRAEKLRPFKWEEVQQKR